MPEGAQVALALPPVPGILDDIVPIVRVFHSDESIQMALAEAFKDMGEDLGVEADSYESLAAALGVDPASSIGFFADFTAMAISAARVAAEENAAAAPALDGDGGAPETEVGDPSSGGSSPLELDASVEGMEYLEAAEEPIWAAVLAVTDPVLAIAALERIAAENEAIQAATPGSEEVDGVTLTTRGDFGYFSGAVARCCRAREGAGNAALRHGRIPRHRDRRDCHGGLRRALSSDHSGGNADPRRGESGINGRRHRAIGNLRKGFRGRGGRPHGGDPGPYRRSHRNAVANRFGHAPGNC
jgi:hypothetical protein